MRRIAIVLISKIGHSNAPSCHELVWRHVMTSLGSKMGTVLHLPLLVVTDCNHSAKLFHTRDAAAARQRRSNGSGGGKNRTQRKYEYSVRRRRGVFPLFFFLFFFFFFASCGNNMPHRVKGIRPSCFPSSRFLPSLLPLTHRFHADDIDS